MSLIRMLGSKGQRLFALTKYFQCYLIIKKSHSHYSSSQIFGDKRPFFFWIKLHSASPLKTCFLAILPRYSPFFCCVLYIPICAYRTQILRVLHRKYAAYCTISCCVLTAKFAAYYTYFPAQKARTEFHLKGAY